MYGTYGLVGLFCCLLLYTAEAQQPLQRATTAPSGIQLPDWYLANRVHLIGTGGVGVLSNRDLMTAMDQFVQSVDPVVVTRHVKLTKCGDPAWPSQVPKDRHGRPVFADQPDAIQAMVDRVHQSGRKLMVYYFINCDRRIEQLHPEWVCRDASGRAVAYKANKGFDTHYLDITGPYREIVLQRLMELADRGVDGFMFDETHLPIKGVWGTSVQAAWEASGHRTPDAVDLKDANYLAYRRFQARRIEDTFIYWRNALKRKYPHVVMTVSVTSLPHLMPNSFTTRMCRVMDGVKNEYDLPCVHNGIMTAFFRIIRIWRYRRMIYAWHSVGR